MVGLIQLMNLVEEPIVTPRFDHIQMRPLLKMASLLKVIDGN